MKEKEFNEAVQRYLHEELVRCGIKHVDVDENSNDSLATRAKRVNASGAHLHIDIHANAFNNILDDKAGGIETYCWWNMSSRAVAQVIHKHIMKGTKMKDRGVKNGNHLYMINSVNPISILVELGFMDNKYDVEQLLSDAYRRECAVELAKGICEVFGKTYVPKPTTNDTKGESTVTQPKLAKNPGAFTDIEKSDDFNEVAQFLKDEGIFAGYPDGRFGVSDNMTRKQFALVIYQVIKHLKGGK